MTSSQELEGKINLIQKLEAALKKMVVSIDVYKP